MDLKPIIDVGIPIATILGGAFTIYTYWQNSRLKRTEWLYQLYEKFYEESYYKEIRRIIDYDQKDGIKRLKNGIENDCEEELVELLVDYLNFFEFIASLEKLKQLTIKEIAMVFEYYILRIAKYDFLNKFLIDNRFDNLPELIAKLKKKK